MKSNTANAIPKPGLPASEILQQVAKKVDNKGKASKDSLKKLKALKRVTEPTKRGKWTAQDFLTTGNTYSVLATEDGDEDEEEDDDENANQCSLFNNFDDGPSTTKKRPLGSPELRDNERRVRNKSNSAL